MGAANLEKAASRKLEIEGVTVSVRPSAHIRVSRQRGADLHGAVVIDVAKGIEPKTDDAKARLKDGMTHSAIILHQHVVETAPEGGKPSPDHCFIFHTHHQERITAPTSYKKTYRNIEAVCRNIARSWNGIVPPANFDKNRATHRCWIYTQNVSSRGGWRFTIVYTLRISGAVLACFRPRWPISN
jgi:hypothetical protein